MEELTSKDFEQLQEYSKKYKGTEDLAIYKKNMELILTLMEVHKNIAEYYRRTLTDRALTLALDMLDLIIYANEDKENRVDYLDNFQKKLHLLKSIIKVYNESKLGGISRVSKLLLIIDSLIRQSQGWKNKALEDYTVKTV